MADLSGSHSLEIDAPVERCFVIAADVERAPEWQGAMRSARALEYDDAGRPTLVETELDSSVAKHRLRLRFSYDEPRGMTWTRESGDLKSLEGSWRFEDLGDGRTRATYSLDIGLSRGLSMLARTVKGPVEARVRSLLAHRPVEGLKARAETAD
jgi:ribosome-associated toxin RatA of RatAB toxin-antitoxin module